VKCSDLDSISSPHHLRNVILHVRPIVDLCYILEKSLAFFIVVSCDRSRDRAVGIATDYGPDDLGDVVRVPADKKVKLSL
jgi:hypothetical protein